MNRAESLTRVVNARRGHLATVRPDGHPHVVVITFAVVNGTIVTAIDQKPKKTTRLQRLINIEANPSVSFLVDHYDDDWRRLWWVRIDGVATVHHRGEIHGRAIAALTAKYPQYQERAPEGPVIAIVEHRVSSWSHNG